MLKTSIKWNVPTLTELHAPILGIAPQVTCNLLHAKCVHRGSEIIFQVLLCSWNFTLGRHVNLVLQGDYLLLPTYGKNLFWLNLVCFSIICFLCRIRNFSYPLHYILQTLYIRRPGLAKEKSERQRKEEWVCFFSN